MRVAARSAVVLVAAVVLGGCGGGNGCGSSCTRVLFVGNSYTYVNDLPATFASLAESGHHPVETGMLAWGGATLGGHAIDAETRSALGASRWSDVVLQEQSQIPAVPSLRQTQMYPPARKLVAVVRDVGARPLFFVTWAHRDGWPEEGIPDYATMQAAVDAGYLEIAREQNVPVVPVGYAWWITLAQERGGTLWQEDGSHPTPEGTYLAACVFYAAVFRESPVGLAFQNGLPPEQAARLQKTAADVVLGHAAEWGLG